MIDNNKEIIIRYDLDEYIENIISGLSDEECQEIINSTNNGYLTGIVKPEHIKNYLRNSMRKMMLKSVGRDYVKKTGECPMCEDCPDNCPLDKI